MVGMPTDLGPIYVISDGAVVHPVQPEPESIARPDEPQVFVAVPPDAVYLTAGARLLAEGWKSPFPELERVFRQREALLVTVQRIKARAVEDVHLIARAIHAGDAEAAFDASIANALHSWIVSERLHEMKSPAILAGLSIELEVELEKLLWLNQRAVLTSLHGRNSAAVQVLRRRVERMAGTMAPRQWAAISPTEYSLFRREVP